MNACCRRDRKGQSLILVLLILIALAGVLALTFDYGFVILARRQMQTGVNASALDGLRGQGIATYDVNDQLLRRENAQLLLRSNFDDDFDLTSNSSTIGTGVDRSLIQGDGFRSTTIGTGDTTLAEDLANRSTYIYRPNDFELNQDNAVHGDMVVGQSVGSSVPRPLSGAAHQEFSDYRRMDFRTSDETDYDSALGDGAFLSRLRRTHDPDGLDEVLGISSRGGGLPLLLGLLGWMNAEPGSAAYSIRQDGVVVRATAISRANPATAISPAIPTGLIHEVDEVSGSSPFILNATVWGGIGIPQTFTVDSNGTDLSDQVRLIGITSLAEPILDSDTTVTVSSNSGFPISSLPFVARIGSELLSVIAVSGTSWTVERGVRGTGASGHSNDALIVHHTGRNLGQGVVTFTSVRPPSSTDINLLPGKSAHVYVPLFDEINGIDRIIGFGLIDWSWLSNELTITPLSSIVGPRGVSATGFTTGLGADDIEDLLLSRAALDDLLLAPIHARTVQ